MGRKKSSDSSHNVTIVVAILGTIGTIITAYLAILPSLKPSDFELALIATQTAEIRQTAAAQVLAFVPADDVNTSSNSNTEGNNNLQATETPVYTEVVPTNSIQNMAATSMVENTPTSQPTKISEGYTDPISFINEYFSLINERRYEDAWARLSNKFKENFANRTDGGGYNDYVDYWNTVNKVEIAFIEIQSQSDTQAIVYAEILFNYKAGNTETGHIKYKLVKDTTGKSWLFDPN
jgi:hypothetical protein